MPPPSIWRGPLPSAQAQCLPQRCDSRGIGEGEAENHFVSAGLDVPRDQAGNLVRLANGESGDLFSRGGLEILNAIEHQGFDVLRQRPSISKTRKLLLVARAAAGKLL